MKTKLFTSLLLLPLALYACASQPASPAEPQAGAGEPEPELEEPAAASPIDADIEPAHLKIAVLPILDALPMHVALEQGYFDQFNLDVELVPVTSAPERDQLMQAGQVDGMINEIVSVMFYNQQEPQVVIVRFARAATANAALFSVLASADSGITTVDDLAGIEIGVSEGTVIEYVTDRVLQHAGLTSDEIVKVAIPRIPDRLNLLQSGELEVGVLPDPVTALAIQSGAVLVIDDSSLPEVGVSVISFSVDSLEQKPETVRGFLAALEMAVADLNEQPQDYVPLMVDLGILPPPLAESFELLPYVTASVPSEAQWADALEWAQGNGLLEGEPAYAESVDTSFLP